MEQELEAGTINMTKVIVSIDYLKNVLPGATQWRSEPRSEEFIINMGGPRA